MEKQEDFAAKVKKIVVEPWDVTACSKTEIRIELRDTDYSIPKYVIHVDSSLHFSLHVFNWLLPEQHTIYTTCGQRINSAELSELLLSISGEEFKICEGLRQDEYISSIAKDPVDETLSNSDVYRHVIPTCISKERNYGVLVVLRSAQCMILFIKDTVDDQVICETCHKLQKRIVKQRGRKERQDKAPAKDKAPLAACGAEKLRATVIARRLHCKDLEAKVNDLQNQIEKHGVSVSESLEKDLLTIMSGQNLEATPHMRFFWEQQMHLMRSTKMGRRYHSQMIRFALSIHCKSPSAYRELRDSGALILPSERVLRDYKNYFKPGAGITKENIEELKEKTSEFSGIQKYIAVIMDEMKIQENLVFDKTSGELIGFIDLGDPLTTFANVDEDVPVASHAFSASTCKDFSLQQGNIGPCKEFTRK